MLDGLVSGVLVSLSKMKFATAINCMDGRTQLPVIAYLKEKCKVDYVDMVTEAGPVKILADPQGASTDGLNKEKS